jgi:hypothetical protein
MIRTIVLGLLWGGLALAQRQAALLPLEMGNYWVYREAKSGESFTVRVGQPVWTQDGRAFHYVSGYSEEAVIARIDERGNLLALDPENGKERLVIGWGVPSGEWWEAPAEMCSQQGQTLERRAEYEGPSGKWLQALVVQYRSAGCGDAGRMSELFAENVGMLQRTVTTLAGPKRFELVYARVGNQVIETRQRARFSIAIEESGKAGVLRATMRIDLGEMVSLPLRFGTAQVYDLALRDASGKVVWLWSEGKFFEAGERVVEIGNAWSESLEVPRPEGDLLGYRLEAWLKTVDGEARLGAVMGLR